MLQLILNMLWQRTILASKHIHHKKVSEEHLHLEMGHSIFQTEIIFFIIINFRFKLNLECQTIACVVVAVV